jgi:outer membrane protein
MRGKLAALVCALCLGLALCPSPCRPEEVTFDLGAAIRYAVEHNPSLRISEKGIDAGRHGVEAAKAGRFPKVDIGSGISTYRYPHPLTPIVFRSTTNPATLVSEFLNLPDFVSTIYEADASFSLPLYQGGRITGNIRIADTQKALAQDNYRSSRQDLVHNVTSVYHKILQLQRLLAANEAAVVQIESHRRDVEYSLQAGAVPRVDLLKTDVDLERARENLLLVKNNLASAFELLRNLMGMEDGLVTINVVAPQPSGEAYPSEEDGIRAALKKRPDYLAVSKKIAIAEDRVKVARGRRLPDVYAFGQYLRDIGNGTSLKEDWSLGLRMTVPVFDGGLIRADVERERTELEKARLEERALRLAIYREVRDARITIANAVERIKVAQAAVKSARETVRVQRLRFQTGAGTTTEVLDANTTMLRCESDYYQALYDREIALAGLRKSVGEDPAGASGG